MINSMNDKRPFSKDDLYNIVVTNNHACNVNFVPGTRSYSLFGECITVTSVCDFTPRMDGCLSYGRIRCEVMVSIQNRIDEHGNFKIGGITKTVEFDTNDILDIEHI